MMRKVLEAVIELAPRCVVDLFCVQEKHLTFGRAFYGDIKNLNLILGRGENYPTLVRYYDSALQVSGNHFVIIDYANAQGLNAKAPALLEVCAPCVYIVDKCPHGFSEPPCMLSHTPQTVCEVTCTYLKNNA